MILIFLKGIIFNGSMNLIFILYTIKNILFINKIIIKPYERKYIFLIIRILLFLNYDGNKFHKFYVVN